MVSKDVDYVADRLVAVVRTRLMHCGYSAVGDPVRRSQPAL